MKKTTIRAIVSGILLVWTVCASAAIGHTHPLLEMFGSPSVSNPLTSRAWMGGSAATYLNPALLVDQQTDTAGVSFLYLGQFLSIGLASRADSLDISSDIYNARIRLPDGGDARLAYRPLPTDSLRHERGWLDPDSNAGYLELGGTLVLWPKRLVLGLHAMLPAGSPMQQASGFPDEREQFFSNSLQFELLGDRLLGSALSLGLGGRVFSWLDVGLGLTMSTASRAITDVYIQDATYQETAFIQTRFKVDVLFVPHVALTLRPIPELSISSTLYLPSWSSMEGGTEVQMWNYPYSDGKNSLTQRFEFSSGYEPLRIGLGLAYASPQSDGLGWGVAATGQYARWSTYRNRHNEAPQDPFHDTLSAALGGRVELGAHVLGLDLAYTPSPIPEQTGRSNYVDNPRLGASLGWQLKVPLAGRNWTLGLQAQVHHLLSQSVSKTPDATNPVFDEFPDSVDVSSGVDIPSSAGLQTNNPGYPGFSSEGWLVGAAVSLSVEL